MSVGCRVRVRLSLRKRIWGWCRGILRGFGGDGGAEGGGKGWGIGGEGGGLGAMIGRGLLIAWGGHL